MPLKLVDRENLRKEVIVPGIAIRKYVTADFKERINPDLIMRILESFGIDTGGNKIHKIIFNDKKEVFVNDAGLSQLLS